MDILTPLLNIAIKEAFPSLPHVGKVIPSTNSKFGDYQSSDAMLLLHRMKTEPIPGKTFKSPREIGLEIVKHLPTNSTIGKVDVAGNGFINFFLSSAYLEFTVQDVLKNGCRPDDQPEKLIIVDFSSPNIAKEMHVGHLRSTIIGESICRILEFCGHNVQRINHIGNWGTQFGMLIAYLKEQFPNTTGEFVISDLQKFYKASKVRFDTDPQFKQLAHEEVVRLQSGDPTNRQLWQRLCEISMNSFEEIYQRLDVHLEVKGESFYNERVPPLIHQLQERGLVKEDNGAQCFFIPGYDKHPLMVQKSDGGFSYDSTDLAAVHYRLVEEKACWVIYVVDVSQSEHFELLFEASRMAGWSVPGTNELTHVAFGMVCGEDGKRFKTRSGETVKLVDLLDEAVTRSEQVLIAKNREGDLSPEEMKNVAKAVGYGAVKYADLHTNRLNNYIFSFDRMLDFKGNTAVYLLYAHARVCSILRKGNTTETNVLLEEKSELLVARHLARFHEVIQEVSHSLQLHVLCEYLYDLADAVTAFHRDCRVLGDPKEQPRLALLTATSNVMKTGLHLLGIEAPEKI